MDDMYVDLRPLLGVDGLEEMRNENKKMLEQIEEHAADMEKIKKSYDVLDIAFKSLQCNYSSLLSSTQAEIQRNAQMIAQLKAEKEAILKRARGSKAKYVRRYAHLAAKQRASGRGGIKKDDPKQDKNDDSCEK